MAKSKLIFEEVGSQKGAKAPERATGIIDQTARNSAQGAIRLWLMALFALVVLIIAVGGITRLTDSGLSITEWQPVTGAVPPMNAAAWEAEFAKYRETPEYQLQNKGMLLSEFKFIYWWEWGHRQLGRVVGLVWAAGFLFFWLAKRIPEGWTHRLLLVGILGGLQGVIGWWMVSTGLTGVMLDVASYMLAIHLGLAFAILGTIVWLVLKLSRTKQDLMQARRSSDPRLRLHAAALMGMVLIQILLGALVAGIDAGRNYIDWPLMAGGFFPPDMWQIQPIWRNLFENEGTVQFIHRMWAYATFLVVLMTWRVARRSAYAATRRAFNWIAVIAFGQMTLGIVTVMSSAALQLAVLHQLMAVLLWVLVLRGQFLAQYPITQSIREAP